MGGSLYFAALVAAVFIVISVIASPLFLIPGVVLVLVALFAAPLLAAIGRGGGAGPAAATKTTDEAAYEPVAQPEERSV